MRAPHDQNQIKCHSADDFKDMREAGRLAAQTLDMIGAYVVPGVTTGKLDDLCHQFILDHGATPAPLGYRGFPKSICTSVNHVVCHGIPGKKVLHDGDMMNIDVTVILNGWHGDTSRMYFVGEPKIKAARLVDATFAAMWKGIEVIRPGATTGDIGHAIQTFAESLRYGVVREFCGHGLGRVFHDVPNILHYGVPNDGYLLQEGMFFTIEPMLNAGNIGIKILDDGWTAVTRDKSLSAQFEHSVAVTATGYEVFTLSPKGLDRPPYHA